jgi:integrase/recombinase XerD
VPEPRTLDSRVADFAVYLRDERGLSPTTLEGRCWYVQRFFDALMTSKRSPAELTVEDVDNFLNQQAKQGWCRVSVATGAKALRSFFRYAAMRLWCSPGIADAIDAPRVFKFEGLPSGPEWEDVRRLVISTGRSDPHDIRDRAILMLLAAYGLRSGEVRKLNLTDLDWHREVITIRRSKQRLTQSYPLVYPVGDAILQYLRQVRPLYSRRELFLTVVPPFGPLSAGCMYHVVSRRIRELGIKTRHYGPHCLRHACATHLVAQGLSLKEIGDHLGHRSSNSTRIYAKVDLLGLREVADFDLRGLS